MEQNGWLIVFLIYADYRGSGFKNNEKTFRELENVLRDFKECKINDGVKIVFAFNSIRFVSNLTEPKEEDFTYIYEVKKSKHKSSNSFKCIDIINNEQKPGLGEPQTVKQLSNIFVRIKQHFKSLPAK